MESNRISNLVLLFICLPRAVISNAKLAFNGKICWVSFTSDDSNFCPPLTKDIKLFLKYTFTDTHEIARSVLGKDCVVHACTHLHAWGGLQFYNIRNVFAYLGFFQLLVNGEHLKDVIQNGRVVPERTTWTRMIRYRSPGLDRLSYSRISVLLALRCAVYRHIWSSSLLVKILWKFNRKGQVLCATFKMPALNRCYAKVQIGLLKSLTPKEQPGFQKYYWKAWTVTLSPTLRTHGLV